MAQTVFRPNQIKKTDGEVMLKLAREFAPPVVEVEEEVPEYTGPTADDIRKEAEEFKKNWEAEKSEMIARAKAEADKIIKDAEEAAFAEVKKQSDQAAVIKNSAEQEAQTLLSKNKSEADEILQKAKDEEQRIFEKARKEGFEKGSEEGFKSGNQEAERLVERLHKMIDSVQDRRQEILNDTEQQIVDLVVLMTRKVVKILSENQKSVVMANVVQALKKVKGRGNIILRVNLADLKLTTEHTKDFIAQVENIKGISVVEDSSVGGCIVETDFGAVDARIASQLGELESKILELSPMKAVSKTAIATGESN